jgi:DNA (cytosine-5)-methyltransferase 1
LEETVDESFYLTSKQLNYAIDLNDIQKGTKWEGRCDDGKLNPGIASTLGVRSAGGNQRIGVSNFVVDGTDEEITAKDYKNYVRQIGQIYSGGSNPQSGCVGTITTDGSSPKHNNRVLVWDGYNQRIRADQSCVGTLTQNCGANLKRNGQGIIEQPLRIRKLTPLECWRLMDFDDEDYYKADKVNSASQLYKQAGNSIVVAVLEHLLKQVFKAI